MSFMKNFLGDTSSVKFWHLPLGTRVYPFLVLTILPHAHVSLSIAALLQASFSMSQSLTVEATRELHRSEFGPGPEVGKPVLTMRLIFTRLAAVGVCTAIFFAGLILRLLSDRDVVDTVGQPLLLNVTSSMTDSTPTWLNVTM